MLKAPVRDLHLRPRREWIKNCFKQLDWDDAVRASYVQVQEWVYVTQKVRER